MGKEDSYAPKQAWFFGDAEVLRQPVIDLKKGFHVHNSRNENRGGQPSGLDDGEVSVFLDQDFVRVLVFRAGRALDLAAVFPAAVFLAGPDGALAFAEVEDAAAAVPFKIRRA